MEWVSVPVSACLPQLARIGSWLLPRSGSRGFGGQHRGSGALLDTIFQFAWRQPMTCSELRWQDMVGSLAGVDSCSLVNCAPDRLMVSNSAYLGDCLLCFGVHFYVCLKESLRDAAAC